MTPIPVCIFKYTEENLCSLGERLTIMTPVTAQFSGLTSGIKLEYKHLAETRVLDHATHDDLFKQIS